MVSERIADEINPINLHALSNMEPNLNYQCKNRNMYPSIINKKIISTLNFPDMAYQLITVLHIIIKLQLKKYLPVTTPMKKQMFCIVGKK